MQHAALGGTFHTLHAGHRALLLRAKPFSKITIGLTSDAYAKRMKIYPCAKYAARCASLRRFLSSNGMLSKTKIVPINGRFGPSASDKSLSAIVVSEETEKVALQINKIRKKRRLPPLKIISIPMVRANDGIRVSCSRVEDGKIDLRGTRKKPLLFAIGTKNPVKISGAKAACKRAFGRIPCKFLTFKIPNHAHLAGQRRKKALSARPEQPIGFEQTWMGAKKRAEIAFELAAGKGHHESKRARMASFPKASFVDYGVGLESGLIKFGGKYFDIQFCCLFDGSEYSAGSSMGFPIPAKIQNEIMRRNSSLGTVVSRISGIKNIGEKGGALAFLSGGLLHRKEMVVQAFLCAMVERRAKI